MCRQIGWGSSQRPCWCIDWGSLNGCHLWCNVGWGSSHRHCRCIDWSLNSCHLWCDIGRGSSHRHCRCADWSSCHLRCKVGWSTEHCSCHCRRHRFNVGWSCHSTGRKIIDSVRWDSHSPNRSTRCKGRGYSGQARWTCTGGTGVGIESWCECRGRASTQPAVQRCRRTAWKAGQGPSIAAAQTSTQTSEGPGIAKAARVETWPWRVAAVPEGWAKAGAA